MECIGLSCFFNSLVESPLLMIVACLGMFKIAGAVLNSLWCVVAALILRDCDFLTKILPEKKDYWKDRTAWVTGACSGIGLSVARLLAMRGCKIIMSSNRPDALKAAVDDIIKFCNKKGTQRKESDFLVLPCDMLHLETLDDTVVKAKEWQGKIDFLFNNAGIIGVGALMPYKSDERVVTIDLLAQMKLSKLVIPIMKEAGFGHIIFTASMYSRFVTGGFASYCAAKHGLRAFAEGLDREFRAKGYNIAVTNICPGWVDTPIYTRAVGPAEMPQAVDYKSKKVTVGLSSDTVAAKILKSSSNQLTECWVSRNPELLIAYFNYYVPFAARIFLDISARSMCAATDETVADIIAQKAVNNPRAELR
ncbi:putative oxidoreductase [Toxoplasma gondii RUB]|uniref:Oxidoreductase, putative n=11 Tax=Toxoplasma gondii TaxID=5811 RepID=B9PH73_TOXGV|nr:putative oxidoreductase [Toxoplasma gondii GT1]ESS36367.1 putative oxidoreductase [Toxoplasma gondii VEG]KAF4642399.1 putative oxidoreductase [Toxoplasma gondii]KFG43983.1 putative oxidoreductase [Toxoplasma gondii GAB2-2007-GAL-DOM2]KFG52434.1 putative oxidoreductase [Toxoplasma gondii p89]KFG54526.1 putative oxidoreductase [Toxoplasma gondii FOU]KFG61469.1 putative oxidoreductase [Toxoplasma gondii RUB]KFH06140.1 putative oxidoreductase [Toxoplasma gondii VAND]KFH16798.1 putative oxido